VISDWGGIDILIHSAGILKPGSITEASVKDFDMQYSCNVRAPYALTQIFLPGLIRTRGQIVFINSTCGLTASRGLSQYSATKHALKAVADSIRKEVNPLGIRVISVFLGRTATPMQARVHRLENKPYRPERLIQPGQVASAVVNTLLLGREAEVMDIRIRPFKKPARIRTIHEYNSAKKTIR
jgi:short-subunit dehydrogenase